MEEKENEMKSFKEDMERWERVWKEEKEKLVTEMDMKVQTWEHVLKEEREKLKTTFESEIKLLKANFTQTIDLLESDKTASKQ